MTPELLKTEADNCDAQSGLSPAPLLDRDPVTGQIRKGNKQIWTHEELVQMGKKGTAKRLKNEPDFSEKSRALMLKLRTRKNEWEEKRVQSVKQSLRVKMQCRKMCKIGQPLAWEVCKNDPRFQKGLLNQARKDYSLLSPDLDHYEGENLLHFVRTHTDIFDPKDVTEPFHKSRAYNGLRQIMRPSPSFKCRTWKGWTKAV